MTVLIIIVMLAATSVIYVYRLRGQARYASLVEYFRKGWPIFAPFNCLLYLTTRKHAARAVLDPHEFPELAPLRQHWQIIREEALELARQDYFDATKRPGTASYYDIGFRTFFKYGWSRFYLKWYGYTHKSAQRLCPRTVELLQTIPTIQGAMFALLPPQSQLTRHADPLAVSLRYHLGLITPNDDACFINVDGQQMSWRDGEVLMFDETYLHYVRNDTDHSRMILMCDITRPVNPLGTMVNFFYRSLTRASVVPNTLEDKRGLANRLFATLSPALARSKQLKQTRRPLYLLLKWSVNTLLLLLLLGLIAGFAMLITHLI